MDLHADELTPSEFIKGVELKGDVTFTISHASIEKVSDLKSKEQDKKVSKGIIYFSDHDKGWVINTTNKELLKGMFGPLVKDWLGKPVTLHGVLTNVGREKKVGVRVKGSPILTEPIKVVVALPKKKPETFTLVPTGNANQRPPNRNQERGQQEDPAIAARILALKQHASASGHDPDRYVQFFGDYARNVTVPVEELIKATSPSGVEYETMMAFMRGES